MAAALWMLAAATAGGASVAAVPGAPLFGTPGGRAESGRCLASCLLAGQSRGAVPVPLGARALRLLRHGAKLRVVAVVRTGDGNVTRSSLKIRSRAPR